MTGFVEQASAPRQEGSVNERRNGLRNFPGDSKHRSEKYQYDPYVRRARGKMNQAPIGVIP